MIEARNVTKTYVSGRQRVDALDGIDFTVEEGDFTVVHGPSGSGKTTLLLTLGGMLRPTAGSVTYRGDDIYSFSALKLNKYRKRHVGFVFQKFFLLPYLTAEDNIRLSLALRGEGGNARQRIADVAARFGITDRLKHRPWQLSVGEQQRVAMARAIVAEPDIILADEPTGNLDRANSETFAQFLTEEHRQGRTIVVVTHDDNLLGMGNRSLELRAGTLATTS